MMGQVSQPDLWLWLGDNMYRDGQDINAKRLEYNKGRQPNMVICRALDLSIQ